MLYNVFLLLLHRSAATFQLNCNMVCYKYCQHGQEIKVTYFLFEQAEYS